MINQSRTTPNTMMRIRRGILISAVISWGIWQGCRTLVDLGVSFNLLRAVRICEDITYGAWLLTLVALALFIVKMFREPALAATITDELYNQVRLKAGCIAFGVTMVVTCVVSVIATSSHLISTLASTDIVILFGITSFIGSALYMDRD